MLSEADVFVGTYSSNVARRVALMRHANGLERGTALSVDVPTWHAGRRWLGGISTSIENTKRDCSHRGNRVDGFPHV